VPTGVLACRRIAVRVFSLFTTRVARAVRVRRSYLSYPFVFVSFTLHIIRRPFTAAIITHRVHTSNTFRIRVLEDRTRSVFDMDTRFSPFPNHVNALSGTTLRRPFFYCPTVRHYYTMYRYNAAGIVPPNRYCHTTTAARTTTTTSTSSSYCFEFFVHKSIIIYCVSVLIATNRYGMPPCALTLIGSYRAPVQSNTSVVAVR